MDGVLPGTSIDGVPVSELVPQHRTAAEVQGVQAPPTSSGGCVPASQEEPIEASTATADGRPPGVPRRSNVALAPAAEALHTVQPTVQPTAQMVPVSTTGLPRSPAPHMTGPPPDSLPQPPYISPTAAPAISALRQLRHGSGREVRGEVVPNAPAFSPAAQPALEYEAPDAMEGNIPAVKRCGGGQTACALLCIHRCYV